MCWLSCLPNMSPMWKNGTQILPEPLNTKGFPPYPFGMVGEFSPSVLFRQLQPILVIFWVIIYYQMQLSFILWVFKSADSWEPENILCLHKRKEFLLFWFLFWAPTLQPPGGGISSLWLLVCSQSAADILSCISDSDFLELGDTA